MRLATLLLMCCLSRSSYQSSWAELLNLDGEQALNYLNHGLLPPHRPATPQQMEHQDSAASTAVWAGLESAEHHLSGERGHIPYVASTQWPTQEQSPRDVPSQRRQSETALVQEGQYATKTSPTTSSELKHFQLHPPAPLAIEERIRLLETARDFLIEKAQLLNTPTIHPYKGQALSPEMLRETYTRGNKKLFALTETLFVARHPDSLESSVALTQGRISTTSPHQNRFYLWKKSVSTPLGGVVLHFIGMIGMTARSKSITNRLTPWGGSRTRKMGIVGEDSIYDPSLRRGGKRN